MAQCIEILKLLQFTSTCSFWRFGFVVSPWCRWYPWRGPLLLMDRPFVGTIRAARLDGPKHGHSEAALLHVDSGCLAWIVGLPLARVTSMMCLWRGLLLLMDRPAPRTIPGSELGLQHRDSEAALVHLDWCGFVVCPWRGLRQ